MRKRLLEFLLACGVLGALASPTAGQSCDAVCNTEECRFKSLQNSPIGDAFLAIDPACRLVVDGIGGSGQDGVVQSGLRSVYMKTTLSTPNLSLSATGTKVTIRQVGVVDAEADQEIMLTELVNFNEVELRHSISCSEILVEGYRIWIYLANQLIVQQELGSDPPTLIYPKADISWIACGIRPGGDAYTVFRFTEPREIRLQVPAPDPGPFVGELVVVEAFSPQRIPKEQTRIENTFFATGPITIESIEAGSLPGYGSACAAASDRQSVNLFAQLAWDAVATCAQNGAPICPAPCPGFPTLDESGLSPRCYDAASSYIDNLAWTAFASSWGTDRCPHGPADVCSEKRARVVRRLLSGGSAPAFSELKTNLEGTSCLPRAVRDELERWSTVLLP